MAAGFELAFSVRPRTTLSRFRESWDEFAPRNLATGQELSLTFATLEPHRRLAGSTRRPASCCVAASGRLTVALAARRLASVVSGHDIVDEPQGSKRQSILGD